MQEFGDKQSLFNRLVEIAGSRCTAITSIPFCFYYFIAMLIWTLMPWHWLALRELQSPTQMFKSIKVFDYSFELFDGQRSCSPFNCSYQTRSGLELVGLSFGL